MKRSAYRPPFYRQPPIWIMDWPPILQENLDPSSMIFQKSKPPL